MCGLSNNCNFRNADFCPKEAPYHAHLWKSTCLQCEPTQHIRETSLHWLTGGETRVPFVLILSRGQEHMNICLRFSGVLHWWTRGTCVLLTLTLCSGECRHMFTPVGSMSRWMLTHTHDSGVPSTSGHKGPLSLRLLPLFRWMQICVHNLEVPSTDGHEGSVTTCSGGCGGVQNHGVPSTRDPFSPWVWPCIQVDESMCLWPCGCPP